ncbi:uncharacterized protein LOC141685381 [Apium graveolens]|uniref:uncharacterized protein LOC141685381 n=1 Tax=Apium graveolens TaxID=4045 RepID=UPI003D79CD6E
MTSNPLWDEIQKMIEFVPGCITPNCPDMVSRVLRLKLEQLMTEIKSKAYFIICNGVMYVVEFQKRGLPHVHMLIWLDSAAKKNLKLNMDKYVYAEIPDPLLDPVVYAVVKEFMIHGPYSAQTTFDESGFPIYMRRRQGVVVHVRGTDLDNQWVVPNSCDLLVKEKYKLSKLEEFFLLNIVDVGARKYTYDEIPRYYVWNDGERRWTPRKRGLQIGRLYYAHYSTGEPWFLRLFLTKVCGATSFESIKTVNGVCCNTLCDGCKEYGLLDDDKEWHEVLAQTAASGLPPQIRQLFVHIIVNCRVTDLKLLWDSHWRSMVDDILLRRCERIGNSLLILNDMQLQFYALAGIDELLRSIGKSLKKFVHLSQPPGTYLNNGTNNLIIEETSYDIIEMEREHYKLLHACTEEHNSVYNAMISVAFLEGKIVLPVASSGIAATLMPGGRTTHSRFKIPIILDEFSTCNIVHDSDIAQLIKQTNLIIWDEAPMQHRQGNTNLEVEELKWFAQWVLDIGNCDVLSPQIAHISCIKN